MPLEGHWERQNTPLRRTTLRENRLVVVVTSLTALLVGALVVLAVVLGPAKVARGCLALTTGGTTGSFVVHPCGADAIAFCRQEAARSDAFADRARTACRQARIPGF